MSATNQDIEPTAPWIVDRRVVLGSLAAASAVSLLPLPAASLQPSPTAPALLADWHIDDQWGVYPRYADTVTYSCPATDDAVAENHDA